MCVVKQERELMMMMMLHVVVDDAYCFWCFC
jgi:hypothetical protein